MADLEESIRYLRAYTDDKSRFISGGTRRHIKRVLEAVEIQRQTIKDLEGAGGLLMEALAPITNIDLGARRKPDG